MWVFIQRGEWADVVAIEVCVTAQNLNDKRARYTAGTANVVLTCPLAWLSENIQVQGGAKRSRWYASRSIKKKPTADLVVPVRYRRVLCVVPNHLYDEWSDNNTPTAAGSMS
jgi:hypothetical protein